MPYATIDDVGLATGFYDPAIHELPDGAIPISLETWQAWIADTQGQRWDAEAGELLPYDPPPQPPVVPPRITRRQLLLALVAAELITPAEGLAAAQSGAVPAAIDGAFAVLAEGDALAARITWATMTLVYRSDPLIAALIAHEVATAEAIDALFIHANSL